MAGHKEMPVAKKMTYAVELECDEPNTKHFRHIWCHDANNGKLAELPPTLPEGQPGTIPTLVSFAGQQYAARPCLGSRFITECSFEGKKQFWSKSAIEWKTYAEVAQDISSAAKGIMELPFMQEQRKSKRCVAAILADTSADWQISAQAVFQCGMTVTTVYTTLGHEAMLHGLEETEASILFIDWGQYHVLMKPVLEKCTHLRHIVLIGKCFVPEETKGGESKKFPTPEQASELDPVAKARTCTLEGLIRSGKVSRVDLAPFAPKPDDLAFIMYTSGSTGLPKGVMLTHKSFVALIASVMAQGVVKPRDGDRYIAFLPLAHILELMVETTVLVHGAPIAYAHARTVTPSSPYIHPSNTEGCDLLIIQPTLMVAVPAVLELIKNGLNQKLQRMEGLKGKLVRSAICKALGEESKEGGCAKCLVGCGLGGLLHRKVKAGLGLQNLRLIISGGAPLAPQTQEWIAAVLAPVAQGYGATETTGCTTVQECLAAGGRPADRSTGYVGAIQPSCEVKLASVPDMGYLVTDDPPRGEVLVSGNTVSQEGYYKMEEKSKEDFPRHPDGKVWFHTGDVGEMSSEGTLRIIDRKKDLIKLSGGEYVSLGKVEASLKQVEGIGAVVVFAQSHKDHCVAIVSQPERGWASVGGKPEETALVNQIDVKLRSLKLSRFEIPAKVKVDEFVWTPETGLVTASMKIQRNALREHYNGSGGLLSQMDYRFEQN